jgi:hypothetical protein
MHRAWAWYRNIDSTILFMRINKYGVSPKSERTQNGTTYHSKAEMNYRNRLDMLTKAKGNDKVIKIEEQVVFPIVVQDIKICKYLLDFRVTYPNRVEHIDVKGFITPEFRLKKKLVEALYPIQIIQVK